MAAASCFGMGCGPTVNAPADGEAASYTGSSIPGSATAATTLQGPGGTTAVVPITTSSTGRGSSTLGDDSTTGSPLCQDLPSEATAGVDILHLAKSFESIDLDAICTISGVRGDANGRVFGLLCPAGQFELNIVSELAVELAVPLGLGDEVRVRALRNFPIDSGGHRYIAVRTPAGELIVGNYGFGNVAGVDPATLFAPLTFETARGLCPIIPFEDDTTFISDPCQGDEEVLALDFDDGGRKVRIYDGDLGRLGPFEIRVASALRTYTVDFVCSDGDSSYDRISWTALRVQ